ncbi:DUF1636 family protein [Methylobacterium nodulans]|uniref:Metal-binding protein n=1 Tax=Methylobacterium nodulans (strain LMG 21967 / CNCM I-2342 / ORS 2060) TaxID=460265 RepID=B8IUR2_METNO|nr:DUF1636 domain-containing protein [Methylobacterium nodulans]ACL57130.1 protein of unknown function DUF1636 [Methylobacterium nodulans ORS 2060]
MAVTLYVCTTCRAESDPPDGPRAGARLHATLAETLAGEGVRVEPVECLSVCKRPCTVAVSSPGRWTYVYGDLDPASAPAILRDGLSRYTAAPDGLVPWRERPEAFRKGVIARIPPFSA